LRTFLDRSALAGLLLSAGPIAVLAHGMLGAGSAFTGIAMVAPTAALLLLGNWRAFSPNICDALFGIFVGCVAASAASNGLGFERKELYLLILTLAAYPAARLNGDIFPLKGFVLVAGATVAAGTLATIPALVEQWTANHGKPLVFSLFDAAASQFSFLLGFVLIVLTSDKLSKRSAILISILSAIPVAVFAASMVRFTFVALVVTLGIAWTFTSRDQRKFVAIVLLSVIVSAMVGVVARYQTSLKFARHAATAASIVEPAADRRILEACPAVDIDNSIAICKQLYADAFWLLPNAGLSGIGLEGFPEISCIKGNEVHNTFLQVIVEFGWPAGIALILLILVATGRSTRQLARISPEIRLAFCSLMFSLLLAFVHGRFSRDTALFLFLGYASALRSESFQIAKTTSEPWNSPRSRASQRDATTSGAPPVDR
jgi:hypothetical protein